MEDKINLLESLLEKTEEYGKVSLDLLKLKALDKASDAVSSLLPRLAITLAVLFFVSMVNIGIALWLGEILGESWFGFLAVAAFYGFLGIMLFLFRKGLKKLIGNSIIEQVFK